MRFAVTATDAQHPGVTLMFDHGVADLLSAFLAARYFPFRMVQSAFHPTLTNSTKKTPNAIEAALNRLVGQAS